MKVLLIFGLCSIVASIAIGRIGYHLTSDNVPVEASEPLAIGSTKVITHGTVLNSLNGYYVVTSFSADIPENPSFKEAVEVTVIEKQPWPENITVYTATVKGVPIGDGHKMIGVEINVSVADESELIGKELVLAGWGTVRYPAAAPAEGGAEEGEGFEEKEGTFSFSKAVRIVATEAEAEAEAAGEGVSWFVRLSSILWWVGVGAIVMGVGRIFT